jgi:hypothetical protein
MVVPTSIEISLARNWNPLIFISFSSISSTFFGIGVLVGKGVGVLVGKGVGVLVGKGVGVLVGKGVGVLVGKGVGVLVGKGVGVLVGKGVGVLVGKGVGVSIKFDNLTCSNSLLHEMNMKIIKIKNL